MTYPNNVPIETYCEGRQEWCITSPQFPGTMHRIKSEFVNDEAKGARLPSPLVRKYMANVAKQVEDMDDWGSGP